MIKFKIDDIRDMNGQLKRFSDYLESLEINAEAVFDSRVISCELITNVLRHCGGEALFSGNVCEKGIVISVCSSNSSGDIKVPNLPCALAESGRGLYIVNALSGGNVKIEGGSVTVTVKLD